MSALDCSRPILSEDGQRWGSDWIRFTYKVLDGVLINSQIYIGVTISVGLIGIRYGYVLCNAEIMAVSEPTLSSSLTNAVNSNHYSKP